MLIETTETKNIKSNFLEFDISIASFQITYKNSRIFSLSNKNEIYHNDNRTKQCNFILLFIFIFILISKYMLLLDSKTESFFETVLKWIIERLSI